MPELDFKGKTVLVVGGTSGIGNGIARAFLNKRATVHVWGTRPKAEDYVGEPGSDLSGLHYTRVDVTDHAALSEIAATVDRLDVLVLSQGTVAYGRAEFERDAWHRVMALNLDSVMACAMEFKARLAASQGTLIIISSVSGFRSSKGNPAYAASKAALNSLIRTLGQAWAEDSIRVNGIAPGLVATKLTAVTTKHPERLANSLGLIPMKRLGQPAEIGGVALFLASPLASYMTGQTLIVDGGLTCA